MEMAKYIKCFNCDKKIMFGEFVYHHDYTGAYCSAECYCDANSYVGIVDEDLTLLCDFEVYDDEAREREIREQMEMHKQEFGRLQRELELLTTQN